MCSRETREDQWGPGGLGTDRRIGTPLRRALEDALGTGSQAPQLRRPRDTRPHGRGSYGPCRWLVSSGWRSRRGQEWLLRALKPGGGESVESIHACLAVRWRPQAKRNEASAVCSTGRRGSWRVEQRWPVWTRPAPVGCGDPANADPCFYISCMEARKSAQRPQLPRAD